MNDPTAEYSEPDSPFETGGMDSEPQADAEPSGKAFDLWGLRNDHPPVTPATIGRELDLGAKWYDHIFCGMIKQSNSEGTEAWMHYVVAGLLLANDQYGFLDDGDLDDLEEKTDEWGDVDG